MIRSQPKDAMIAAAKQLAEAHAAMTCACADNIIAGKSEAIREYIDLGPKILIRIQQTLIAAEHIDNMLNNRWPRNSRSGCRELSLSYKRCKK